MKSLTGKRIAPLQLNGGHNWLVCSRARCPEYDGKRCKITGDEPDRLCEPGLAAELHALRAVAHHAREAVADPAPGNGARHTGDFALQRDALVDLADLFGTN